jgi:hypothetical protein
MQLLCELQKLILFLLQRGTMDFNVYIGNLFIPSLEFYNDEKIDF